MVAYLSLIGLAFIILSWIVEIVKLSKGYKEICACFAVMQFIGIVLLVIDSFLNGNLVLGIANALSALGAIIVVFMVGPCNCCNKSCCKK